VKIQKQKEVVPNTPRDKEMAALLKLHQAREKLELILKSVEKENSERQG